MTLEHITPCALRNEKYCRASPSHPPPPWPEEVQNQKYNVHFIEKIPCKMAIPD